MLITTKPFWGDVTEISEYLKEWRTHQGSLTDKLLLATGNACLKLISQSWKKLDWWGKYFLNIQDTKVFQREILMTYQNKNYWYAKTIIPQQCYDNYPDLFERLNKESVRNLIFNNPEVKRIQIADYSVDKHCLEFHWLDKHGLFVDQVIWVRLAQYALDSCSFFYVVELLLPELEKIK